MSPPFQIRKTTLFVAVLVYICIYIGLTLWLFRDDRPSDGPLSLGIPFPFYYGGGICGGPCGPYFLPLQFILDVLILLIPFGIFFTLRFYKSIQFIK